MTSKTQDYEVQADGFLLGDYYRKGAIVALHPKQAEYDLPPYGTMLRPVTQTSPAAAPVPAAKPKTASK